MVTADEWQIFCTVYDHYSRISQQTLDNTGLLAWLGFAEVRHRRFKNFAVQLNVDLFVVEAAEAWCAYISTCD